MYRNRGEAGLHLVEWVKAQAGPNLVVLAIPRGGVPVAAPVADRLCAPLDIMPVARIGSPDNPEVAVGAIGQGVALWDDNTLAALGVTQASLEPQVRGLSERLDHLARACRGDLPPLSLRGRIVVLVDDGVATGYTMRAATLLARKRGAVKVIVAVPVGHADAIRRLEAVADEVVCPFVPTDFLAVGQFYQEFEDVPDVHVRRLLEREQRRAFRQEQAPVSDTFEVPVDGGSVLGDLILPMDCMAVVLLPTAASRFNPQLRTVATLLQDEHLGTFALEVDDPDVRTVADRLTAVCRWLDTLPDCHDLPVGILGAGTAGVGGVLAAIGLPARVLSVVALGAGPELMHLPLRDLHAPTLLIADSASYDANLGAYQGMSAPRRLERINRADHVFHQPGLLARDWFVEHLTSWRPSRTV